MTRLALIGIGAGFFSALFGVGGGIVLVPALILLQRLDARTAMATSLAAIGVTALAGAVVYGLRGHVDVGLAALVGIPAAAGALAGTWLQQRVPRRALALAFAGLLAVIGIVLLAP